MKDASDAVSAKLDTATLAKLVAQVAGGKDPDAVAKAWLAGVGLG
jgi:glycine betaine/choline ABC-type transport system substrate-binding protein